MAQFLNTLFGEVLKKGISLGPAGTRTDILTINTQPNISKRTYVQLVRDALRGNGLTLSVSGRARS